MGILMGISLLMVHMMSLLLGQLANVISFPPTSTVGVISVLIIREIECTIFLDGF